MFTLIRRSSINIKHNAYCLCHFPNNDLRLLFERRFKHNVTFYARLALRVVWVYAPTNSFIV